MKDQSKKPSLLKRMPPLYKKRLLQAVAAYLLVMIAVGAIVHTSGQKIAEEWQNAVPHISAPVVNETEPEEEADHTTAQPSEDGGDTTSLPAPATEAGTEAATAAGTEAAVTAPLDAAAKNAPLVIPPEARKAAYISIIMTNAGLSESATSRAFGELPADFAFAYSPYAENVKTWVKKGAAARRESLLLVPMEPVNFPKEDPGPRTLLTRLSAKENLQNLDWIISRADKGSIIGLMNDKGSRLLSESKSLLPVFSAMAQRNLPFIETSAANTSQALSAADMSGVSYLSTDIKVDSDPSSSALIQQKLAELEKIAIDRGYAVGVAEPYPVSISTLKTWADSLDSRGIRLVPLTKVFKEMSQTVDHETKE